MVAVLAYAQIERVRQNIRTMKTLISKNYRIRTPEILERLYTTYILPKINYCSQQWNTRTIRNILYINKNCGSKSGPGSEIILTLLNHKGCTFRTQNWLQIRWHKWNNLNLLLVLGHLFLHSNWYQKNPIWLIMDVKNDSFLITSKYHCNLTN